MSEAARLQWYMDMGVDEAIEEQPLDRFQLSANTKKTKSSEKQPATPQNNIKRQGPARPEPLTESATPNAARLAAAKARDINSLHDIVSNFNGCSLKRTAQNTVFADGNPESRIMLIGEAPGKDEDRIGKPFVGASGQLLDRMFKAIGMERQKDFYISNILPWRPPGNRKPSPAEVSLCLPFIEKHIELVSPKVIICIGATSACALLQTTEGITRIRGKWRIFEQDGQSIPLMPIFHPAFLLRKPMMKRQVWEDLLKIKEKLAEISGTA